ncbi:hypothetical protein BJX99DRAFT_253233 [Aspergillus californicus]
MSIGDDCSQMAWPWLERAICESLKLGLHREAFNVGLSSKCQQLRKCIWWTCYTRDRLRAINMRTPLAIRDVDFDVKALETEDLSVGPLPSEVLHMLSITLAELQIPTLMDMFVALVNCCRVLSRIFACRDLFWGTALQSTTAPTMSRAQSNTAAIIRPTMTKCEGMLNEWFSSLPPGLLWEKDSPKRHLLNRRDGRVMRIHRALLTAMYLASQSALHMPFVMAENDPIQRKVLSEYRTTHSSILLTDIFYDLDRYQDIEYLPDMGVTFLTTAIITHLSCPNSACSVTKYLSKDRLHFCMTMLQKLRSLHSSADTANYLLQSALNQDDRQGLGRGSSFTFEEGWHKPKNIGNGASSRATDTMSQTLSASVTEQPSEAAEWILLRATTTESEREFIIEASLGVTGCSLNGHGIIAPVHHESADQKSPDIFHQRDGGPDSDGQRLEEPEGDILSNWTLDEVMASVLCDSQQQLQCIFNEITNNNSDI